MRILLLDSGGHFLDFALQCIHAGHLVKMYVTPLKNGEPNTIGDGLIEKVKDWRKWMGWGDLICLSDNDKFMTAMEPFRKLGYPIFGCNCAGAELELNRTVGQKILKDAGVKIMDYKTFNSPIDAEAFVRKTMKRYVSKPNDDADKAMSYVSKSPGDMIYMLQRWKKNGTIKNSFILQEFTPGIEVAVGGWFGPNGFLDTININFEHKKLMNEELGVNTGEMGCYSDDTEVLTSNGWKPWPEVTMEDKLATLDKDQNLFFEAPSAVVSYDVDTEMVGWQSPNVDLLVTQNHNMYVHDSSYRNPMEFKQASDCIDLDLRVLRVGNAWEGEDTSNQLPKFYEGSLVAWAEFLGAYIADGCTRKDRSVDFWNVPDHKRQEWKRIISAIGYEPHEYGNSIQVHSKDMNVYLRQYGKSHEKFAPSYIKGASPEVINSFLNGYVLGDGSRRSNNLTCTTTSKTLADDLQELFHKVGMAANVSTRDRRGESHMIGKYTCVNKQISYDVRVSKEKTKAAINPANSYSQNYKGKVYCATVTSHLLLVRRNGKAIWCGNTVIAYVPSSDKLAKKVLYPVTDYLKEIGYTGYVDVSVIIDAEGNPLPLEFTCRPGWPHFQIISALNNGDPAQWMADLLSGYDTLDVKEGVATGVAITIPDFPYNKAPREKVEGIPVYCDQRPDIHPYELKAGIAPTVVGNKVVDLPTWVSAGTYLCVVTGVAKTVSASARKAYETIKTIEIPNSPGYRTDIGKRLQTQLPELHKLGYCKTITY